MSAQQDAHRVVGLSMIWLAFLVLGSRKWTAKVGGTESTTDAIGQVKAFVQSKVKRS